MTYKIVDCPTCQGEGLVVAIVGSYFSCSQEAYYPEEAVLECDHCQGCGSLELPVLSEPEVISLRKANVKQVEGFNLDEIVIVKEESAA